MKHVFRFSIYVSMMLLLAMIFLFLGCAVKQITEKDLKQLEEAKSLFVSQLENDMHPVIWAYLDEVLHDPDSFRLQRFEYKISNFTFSQEYEKKMYTFGDQREASYYNITTPACRVLMRYRVRIPAGGIMLKEMSFYLLKDKQLILPNWGSVSLSQ